ncbi:MAG: acyltransferase [Terracidiphilus sp.]|jgi:peptidoglycan/LPS O-acetylase OafA/YrhL
MPVQRPTWLPNYLPELDGLRGLAILGVVIYHCDYRQLERTSLHGAVQWGWVGVILFFVLSGFLITSNLLGMREKPRYFHNFHARRALRIWPVYLLVLAFVYLNAPWYVGGSVADAAKGAPWWAYLLFLQNLFHLTLPPALGPTWALALEEQYYFFWAPTVRFLRRPWMLACVLTAALICSPLVRHMNPVWLWGLPTHTLIKLDGIAFGSLMALGLYTLRLAQRTWLWIGLGAFAAGMVAAATVAGGTSLLDTALAVGFGGTVLTALASTGARNPVSAMLRRGPLAFYGRISYGLYMTHILVFVYFGWFDQSMSTYGTKGIFAVVAFRLAATTVVATVLWYGFESQILKLKRYF